MKKDRRFLNENKTEISNYEQGAIKIEKAAFDNVVRLSSEDKKCFQEKKSLRIQVLLELGPALTALSKEAFSDFLNVLSDIPLFFNSSMAVNSKIVRKASDHISKGCFHLREAGGLLSMEHYAVLGINLSIQRIIAELLLAEEPTLRILNKKYSEFRMSEQKMSEGHFFIRLSKEVESLLQGCNKKLKIKAARSGLFTAKSREKKVGILISANKYNVMANLIYCFSAYNQIITDEAIRDRLKNLKRKL